MTRVLAVSAGLSRPSSTRLLADRLATAVAERLGDGVEVETVELREVAHEITDNMLVGFPSGRLREIMDHLASAEGLILVAPTFSASYNGLFKSFMDVIDPEVMHGKPVLLAATGGTERHSLMLEHAMRPLAAYLRAVPVPTAVYAASADWGNDTTLAERVDRAAAELAAAIAKHDPAPVPDGFTDPTPFARLLDRE
ncbi:MAG: CE1759 family FMN reductase [Stackebrandtia sp.]